MAAAVRIKTEISDILIPSFSKEGTRMEQFSVRTKIMSGVADFTILPQGTEKVLIVTDRFLYESGKVDYVTDKLVSLGITYEIFYEVKPDPDLTVVAKGLALINKYKPEAVIAFGGGSAIDAAKAIRFLAAREHGSEKPCYFVAIPTTSGTGSEVSRFSVISDPGKDAKYPLVDDSLLPDAAILDSHLTLSVPPAVTVDTGIDVMTHAMEAFVSLGANDFTDAAAEKSLQLVYRYLPEVDKHPDNREARQKMHHASTLAGIAFSNGGLGINHSMAHTIGGHFHLSHGKANGILMPYVICFNGGYWDSLTETAERYGAIAELFHIRGSSIRQSLFQLLRLVKQYRTQFHIPGSLKEAGIERKDFEKALPEMIKAAMSDRCTKTNPRNCSDSDFRMLFMRAYEGNLAR